MPEDLQKITRREMLKRGAVVGGSVLWATPVVQTLGMGRAFAATPSDVCIASWANSVVSYNRGTRKDGTDVLLARRDPNSALGAPDNKFVSLGYGGTLVVGLATAYYSGHNGEAIVVETSGGNAPYVLERASVAVSGNPGGPWVAAGFASNANPGTTNAEIRTTVIPLDGIAGLPAIVRYVRLIDATNSAPHDDSSDGYDVNAVGIGCP